MQNNSKKTPPKYNPNHFSLQNQHNETKTGFPITARLLKRSDCSEKLRNKFFTNQKFDLLKKLSV